MKAKLRCPPEPCTSCPYRRDTPPGIWHQEEYDKLPAWDNPMDITAGTFLCHQSDRKAVCRGWMEVHHESLAVRVAQIREIDMRHVKPCTAPLYASGAEARRAGMRGIKKPSRRAVEVVRKIDRARRRGRA